MDLIKPTTNRYHFDNVFSKQRLLTENFSIVQIGDLICQSDTIVEEHQQITDLEISLVTEGQGDFFTNNIKTKVKHGDIYLSFKDDLHKITSDPIDTLRYYYFAFDINKHSMYRSIYHNLQKRRIKEDNRLVKLPFLFSITNSILSEISNYTVYSKELLDAYITQVLVGLHRNDLPLNPTVPTYEADLKRGLIHNIIRYIDTKCKDIVTASNIAEHFNYNYDYISQIFKEAMGISIHNYLQNARLNKARLLLEKNRTVTEVASLLNYSSLHNFSRAYKNKFGISPSQVKNK